VGSFGNAESRPDPRYAASDPDGYHALLGQRGRQSVRFSIEHHHYLDPVFQGEFDSPANGLGATGTVQNPRRRTGLCFDGGESARGEDAPVHPTGEAALTRTGLATKIDSD